jgi:hypothetical protein
MAARTIEEGDDDFGTPAADEAVYVEGGATTIDQNLDWSGVTDMEILSVPAGFIADIGSANGPLITRIGTELLYAASAGDLWWESTGSASTTSALAKILGGGHLHIINAGVVTRVEQSSGRLTIGPDAAGTNIRIAGGIADLLDDGSTDPTLLEILAGLCTTERGGTTFKHMGGQLVIDAGANTIGTLEIYSHGLQLLGCGTITQLNAINGIPDLSSLKFPVTVTNCSVNTLLSGAHAFLSHSKLTFTNTPLELFGA